MLVPAALLIFHSAITAVAASRMIRRSTTLANAPFLDSDGAAPPEPRPDRQPAVDVVIPVRNEEHNLPEAVRAALSLTGACIRVLIVDDESTDATVDIARALERADPRVRLVQAGALPSGWVGKNHACHRGAAAATGEWILFVDADVRVAADALTVATGFAESHAIDVLSLSPRQRVGGFWETLVQPLVFELLGELYDMREVNDGRTGMPR
jgi:cellulose synthase/poly-beta-1,6-N-acetylglucosamine synthase-like glycosyltransferase